MSKTINIRGKELFVDFAKTVTKERFCELYSHLKPKAIEQGWKELLKATGRSSESKKQIKGNSRKKS